MATPRLLSNSTKVFWRRKSVPNLFPRNNLSGAFDKQKQKAERLFLQAHANRSARQGDISRVKHVKPETVAYFRGRRMIWSRCRHTSGEILRVEFSTKTSYNELISVRKPPENKELAVKAQFANSWFANSSGCKQIRAMIITRRGMADADGKPNDVDREFVCLYLLFDENVSWYLDHNIQAFTSDPKGVKKIEFAPVDNEGNFSGLGSGFTGTRKQHHDPQFLGLTNNRSRIV